MAMKTFSMFRDSQLLNGSLDSSSRALSLKTVKSSDLQSRSPKDFDKKDIVFSASAEEKLRYRVNKYRGPTKNGDKTAWKMNWFDATKELKTTNPVQRYYMLSSYINKIDTPSPKKDTYKRTDESPVIQLLYLLRVRAMAVMFFDINLITCYNDESFSAEESARMKMAWEFLNRDVSNHPGWYVPRSSVEDQVIQGYQYAYVLFTSDDEDLYEKGKFEFTKHDKLFGKIRHDLYLENNNLK